MKPHSISGKIAACGLLVTVFCNLFPASAQIWLDLEGGLVTGTNYNRIQIPGQTGTRFDPGKELSGKPQAFYRLRAGVTLGDRHTLTALYAPLTVPYDGAFGREIGFNGATFGTGEAVRVNYRFNSYRLTYRYAFVRRPAFRLELGLTGKIRDARVGLTSAARSVAYDNVGFVPLLNFYARWMPGKGRLGVLLEGDALGSSQGRAEDVFAGLTYQLTPALALKGGYRVVEGGADNEKVYNFTWINYASAGLIVRF